MKNSWWGSAEDISNFLANGRQVCNERHPTIVRRRSAALSPQLNVVQPRRLRSTTSASDCAFIAGLAILPAQRFSAPHPTGVNELLVLYFVLHNDDVKEIGRSQKCQVPEEHPQARAGTRNDCEEVQQLPGWPFGSWSLYLCCGWVCHPSDLPNCNKRWPCLNDRS